jgi:hypothetical protein
LHAFWQQVSVSMPKHFTYFEPPRLAHSKSRLPPILMHVQGQLALPPGGAAALGEAADTEATPINAATPFAAQPAIPVTTTRRGDE